MGLQHCVLLVPCKRQLMWKRKCNLLGTLQVLPKAFDLFISKADPKSKQRAERVLKIWEERKVFGRNSSKFRESMKSTGSNGSSTRAKTGISEPSPRKSHEDPNLPVIAKEIVNVLKKAEEMTLNREKITKSFENLNTASGLSAPEQREALKSMLQNCILALEKELESRQNAIVSIEEALQNQKSIEAMIASSLSDCRIQLAACENPADGGNSQDQQAPFGQTSPQSTEQPPTAEPNMNGEEVNVTEAEANALAEQLLSDPSALSMFQEALMATGAQTNEEYTPEETFN